jgi:hypothetical protein
VSSSQRCGVPPAFANPDLETMTKLLRSNNDMQRRQGIEIATRLKKAALGHLHALLGHGRRDVRNSVATALWHIGQAESLPYLVAALYGNTEKPSQFRPGSEAAAAASRSIPLELVRSRQDFQIREAIANLTPQRRAEALRQWVVQGVDHSWHFQAQIRIAQTLDTLTQDKRDILRLIEQKIRAYNKHSMNASHS